MDLRTSFVTIGWLEPALLVSVAVGILAALAIHRALVWLGALVVDPWRRRIYLAPVWIAAILFLLVGPIILLEALFSLEHPGAWACTPYVGWALYIPPLVLGAQALRHTRRRTHRRDLAGVARRQVD